MKKIISKFAKISPAALALTYASSASAQQASGGWRNFIPNPLRQVSGGNLSNLVARVINILLLLAGVIAVIYLIYAGYMYITAGGNAEQATSARTAILNAVIGIVVVFASYLIVNWIFGRFSF